MHGEERCLRVKAGRVDPRGDLADMSTIARGVSLQDCRGVGIGHVIVRVFEDLLLEVLNKPDGVGMLDLSSHKDLLFSIYRCGQTLENPAAKGFNVRIVTCARLDASATHRS